MTLVLRKCWENGHSSYNFFYGNVGERVNCPDWYPEPECGNGLHGLRNGNGNWDLLVGTDWLIIDADDQIVDIDRNECKFNTGIIKFRGTTEELANSQFPSLLQLNSKCAYNWAITIGNHDIMINRIADSESAYNWAKYIGNHDIMINRIANSQYAYLWARTIGNRDIMIDKITESESAYDWARNIGNRDVMINKINNSRDAFYWAFYIGNRDVMINKIINSEYAFFWAKEIGDQDIMKSKVTDPCYINCWNVAFPNNKILVY